MRPAEHRLWQGAPAFPAALPPEGGAYNPVEPLSVHTAGNLHSALGGGGKGRAAHVAFPLCLHLDESPLKLADVRVEHRDSGQGVVERQLGGALQPGVAKGVHSLEQRAVRREQHLRLLGLDGQGVRHLQGHGPVESRGRGKDDFRGHGVRPGVPVVQGLRQPLLAKVAVHHREALQQPHGVGVGGEQRGHVCQVANGNQHHLVGVLPDFLVEELRRVPFFIGAVGPLLQGARPFRGGVQGHRLQGGVQPRHNGHLPPGGPADGVGHRRPFFRLAAHGGDAQQVTLGLFQQIGQADGVVNIPADVCVQQNFLHI